jgi:hypothetical protein
MNLTTSLLAQQAALKQGSKWKDTEGNFINAHGAGILYDAGTYYLFGEVKKGKTRRVPGQNWECYRVQAGGVSCYSSKDLVRWKYEGLALAPNLADLRHDLHTSRVIERPKVVYNTQTRQYVMWMHVDSETYAYSQAGVAVSDTVCGPYRYLRSFRPNGFMSRDLTLFRDDDEKAYIIYSSENNETLHICQLTDDYLAPTDKYKRILSKKCREAPAMFKHLDKYYLITSGCTGWSPNPASYASADSLFGEWNEFGNPCKGSNYRTTFNAQGTFVLPVHGKNNSYLFMADRWEKRNLEDSRYIWLPLRVYNGAIEIFWVDEWTAP